MPRLIDADKLDWWYKGRPIRRVIDEAPTVDAVPVVRCKDCKYRADATDNGNYLCNRKMLGLVRPNDFCSFGERRTET